MGNTAITPTHIIDNTYTFLARATYVAFRPPFPVIPRYIMLKFKQETHKNGEVFAWKYKNSTILL